MSDNSVLVVDPSITDPITGPDDVIHVIDPTIEPHIPTSNNLTLLQLITQINLKN